VSSLKNGGYEWAEFRRSTRNNSPQASRWHSKQVGEE
jgi:hypothetical protein